MKSVLSRIDSRLARFARFNDAMRASAAVSLSCIALAASPAICAAQSLDGVQPRYFPHRVQVDVAPSNPAANFRNLVPTKNGGTRPQDDPVGGFGPVGNVGGTNPLSQHGNVNGGVDHGDTRLGGYIFGARIYSGNFADAIELAWYIPSHPDMRYRVGDQRFATGRIGGNGGVDREWYFCPEGYVAVGLHGSSGTAAVDRIGLTCGKIGAPSVTSTLPAFGGGGGGAFNDNCGQIHSTGYLTGVHVRSGDWMDSIQGLCQEAGN